MAAMESFSSLLVIATILMIAFSPTVTGQISPCDNTLNNVTQTIISQGYPYSNYPNNADCQFSISAQVPTQVIVLSLVYFSLEGTSSTCVYDYVTINDASNTTAITNQIKKICGLVPASQFISNGPIMNIRFHSDSSTTAAGFKFEYSAHNRSELCGNATLSASYGYMKSLISPGYPNAYVSNLDCQWTIRSDNSSYVIALNLLDLTLAGIRYDNLTIYDGPSSSSPVIQTLTGTDLALKFISTGPFLTLVFQTDDSGNYKGFNFQYQSQQKSGACDNTLNSVTQTITSQGYPYSYYPNNANCQWSITADVPTQVIVLSLVYFSLEGTSSTCAYDYVTINDASNTNAITNQIKKICGLVPASQFISNGPIMIIRFHSDSSTNAAGFKFEFSIHKRSELCGSTSLSAFYGYMNSLISPGYPNAYVSNLDCQWIIRSDSSSYVIVLNLLDFTLESLNYDNLTIYDGPSSSSPVIQTLGGTVPASQFISTGSSLTLVFQTDDSGNYKGFNFQYQSQQKSDPGPGQGLGPTPGQELGPTPGQGLGPTLGQGLGPTPVQGFGPTPELAQGQAQDPGPRPSDIDSTQVGGAQTNQGFSGDFPRSATPPK
jgi:hypothetical protein